MFQILADSGSTKTDWILLRHRAVPRRFKSRGLNPSLMSGAQIREVLQAEVLPQLHEFARLFDTGFIPNTDENASTMLPASTLQFYGAGCRPEQIDRMSRTLRDVLGVERANVASDLLGAARALCDRSEGIVCILGTGSGSALYDGTRFVQSTPSLGYILGDEGSGGSLGKHLLADMLKGLFPPALRQLFESQYEVDLPEVIQRVYREPSPNRYLAQFTHFLSSHRDEPTVQKLIATEFRSFFARNIRAYDRRELDIHFVGSIASVFETELRAAAAAENFRVGRILKAPLDMVTAAESSWARFFD